MVSSILNNDLQAIKSGKYFILCSNINVLRANISMYLNSFETLSQKDIFGLQLRP